MTKLMDFVARNQQHLREDVGERPAGNAPPAASKLDGRTRLQNVAAIAVERIAADPQTREIFDDEAMQSLAASVRQHGQLQPIQVIWNEARGLYVIVAGERRWRACKLAGLPTVDCVVVEKAMTEAEILSAQIIENALREDLRPVEQARAFAKAMQMNGWDGKTLAEQLHINPSTVSRALALLKLSDDVQRQVDAGDLPPTIAIKQIARGNGAAKSSPRRQGRASRQRSFKLAGGLMVTVKARRILDDQAVIQALTEALAGVQGDRQDAA